MDEVGYDSSVSLAGILNHPHNWRRLMASRSHAQALAQKSPKGKAFLIASKKDLENLQGELKKHLDIQPENP